MKKLFYYIKNLDYYSETYRLEEDLNSRENTVLGALITVLIFISSMTLGIMFGREIYERKIPFASTSKQYNHNSTVYLKDMPIIIGFTNENGFNLDNIFEYIEPNIATYDVDSKINLSISYSLKLVNCSNVKYDTHQDFIDRLSEKKIKYYCINHTNTSLFKNSFTEKDSTFIGIYFKQCNTNKNKKCPIDLNSRLLNFYATMSFINTYYDSNNYTDPIQYYEYSSTIQLSNRLYKSKYLRFNNNKYITDNGWILEKIVEYNYQSLQDIKIDLNFVNDYNPILFDIILESPRIRETTTRNYLKVYELVAKVGGLVKGFIIAATFFTNIYFQYSYKMQILRLSFSYSNKNKTAINYLKIYKSAVNLNLLDNNFANLKVEENIDKREDNLKEIKNQENSIQEKEINKSKDQLKYFNDAVNENDVINNLQLESKKPQFINSEQKPYKKFDILTSLPLESNILEFTTFYNFYDYLKESIICIKKKENTKITKIENYISKNFSLSKFLYFLKKENNLTDSPNC